MNQETFRLSQKELQRVAVISSCVKGELTCARAAELLEKNSGGEGGLKPQAFGNPRFTRQNAGISFSTASFQSSQVKHREVARNANKPKKWRKTVAAVARGSRLPLDCDGRIRYQRSRANEVPKAVGQRARSQEQGPRTRTRARGAAVRFGRNALMLRFRGQTRAELKSV
jgi:hypothetical protein